MFKFSTTRQQQVAEIMPYIRKENTAERRSIHSGHMRRTLRIVGDKYELFRLHYNNRPVPGFVFRTPQEGYDCIKAACAGRVNLPLDEV